MSTENGIQHSKTIRHHIEVLRGRLEYLEDRDAEFREQGARTNHFVAQEIYAIRWALPILESEWENAIRLRELVNSVSHPKDRPVGGVDA